MEEQKVISTRNVGGTIISIVVLLSMGYAILRYHIAGDVPWKDLPFYILNKGVSLAAFILLTLNFSLGPAKNIGLPVSTNFLNSRQTFGMVGFLLVLVHALMSFMLFSSSRYNQFFLDDGTLTGIAGISMLAGVLGFVFLWGYNLSFQTHLRENSEFIDLITSRHVLMWALTLGGIHLFFMGFSGWLNPAGWHGGLPPISLVAFTLFLFGYVVNLMGRK